MRRKLKQQEEEIKRIEKEAERDLERRRQEHDELLARAITHESNKLNKELAENERRLKEAEEKTTIVFANTWKTWNA